MTNGKSGPAPTSPPPKYSLEGELSTAKPAYAPGWKLGGRVGVRRFELPTPTSLTWCANPDSIAPVVAFRRGRPGSIFRVLQEIFVVLCSNVCLTPEFLEVKFKFPRLFSSLKLSKKNVLPGTTTLCGTVPTIIVMVQSFDEIPSRTIVPFVGSQRLDDISVIH